MEKNKIKKCPVYENCGGCSLQSLSYDEQLELKQKRINELLSGFGDVLPIIGNINHLNYRNKVQVTFGKDSYGRVIVGNFVPSTHIIVPVKECQIVDENANNIIETVKKLVVRYNISVFDEDSLKGCMRHVQIRCGNSGQYMVILVTGTNKIYKGDLLVKDLIRLHPEVKTVIQSINYRHTSMILGDKNITLYGSGYIRDKLCGLDFSISPTAFYQINKFQTQVLYNTALELAELKGDERAIDAYCGIGTISLLLSQKVKEVLGVEINRNAIRDANYNAKLNKINNVSFISDDAGRFMTRLARDNKEKVDLVCMDPPRNGADEKFLSSLVTLGPEKIIYISCGPDSLRNNLFYLTKNCYKVIKIQPVDMFPYTDHVETIVILEKDTKTFNPKRKIKRSFNRKTILSIVVILLALVIGLNFSKIKNSFVEEETEETVIYEENEYTNDLDEELTEELTEEKTDESTEVLTEESNEELTEESVEENSEGHGNYSVSFTCTDDGEDIYRPGSAGYRYGPSIIINDDGSLDAWFSSPGNNSTEWDYIRYRHRNADGTWNKESIVLKPTALSEDHYSVCDPGVICFNGYYYLAYTSTSSSNQCNNSVFVARSENPDGPFEKWNGEGWGGNPEPIVYYEPQDDCWGAGEASFVIKDDTLYLYYSWMLNDSYSTRVMCAPLDDNWPAELEYEGIAVERVSGEDSLDVIYVDSIDRFIAFSNVYKMTEYSGIGVYESEDGLTFKLCDVVRNGIMTFTHNLGVSKGYDGHVDFDDDLILGYAYSQDQATMSWGRWATRFQNIRLNIFIEGD